MNIDYKTKEKQLRYDRAYLRMAAEWGALSHCERKQVGALIVKDSMIISDGYNGTPTGFDNCCEDENEKTQWYVLHAEANAILHSNHKLSGSRAYVTLFPCNECAKLIASSKVQEVVYLQDKHKDKESTRIAKKIFDLSGIKYRQLSVDKSIIGALSTHLETQLADI